MLCRTVKNVALYPKPVLITYKCNALSQSIRMSFFSSDEQTQQIGALLPPISWGY